MEFIVSAIPFNSDDIIKIESMLQAADPLVVAPSNIRNRYDVRQFVFNDARRDASLHVQVDNNVVSTATSLANGQSISQRESEAKVERSTAALLAFFIIGGFELEPNIALYEQAWRSTHEHSTNQLKLFRVADRVHPQSYIDIALDRADRIETATIEAAVRLVGNAALSSRQIDFRQVLQNWKVSYHALLRVIEIERSAESPRMKALSLIEWMAEEHFFSPIPTAMALMFLSPGRPGSLIKSPRSENGEKVGASLQNAAWDCVYIKQWVDRARQSSSKDIWFFSSMDGRARSLARTVCGSAEDSRHEMRRRLLGEYWSAADASAIWTRYEELVDMVSRSPERESQIAQRLSRIDEAIRQIEHRLNLPQARLTTCIG